MGGQAIINNKLIIDDPATGIKHKQFLFPSNKQYQNQTKNPNFTRSKHMFEGIKRGETKYTENNRYIYVIIHTFSV